MALTWCVWRRRRRRRSGTTLDAAPVASWGWSLESWSDQTRLQRSNTQKQLPGTCPSAHSISPEESCKSLRTCPHCLPQSCPRSWSAQEEQLHCPLLWCVCVCVSRQQPPPVLVCRWYVWSYVCVCVLACVGVCVRQTDARTHTPTKTSRSAPQKHRLYLQPRRALTMRRRASRHPRHRR